jgi:hypothetical protein
MMKMDREYGEASDSDLIHRIATLVGLTDERWRSISPTIPKLEGRMEFLMRLLAKTARTSTVLFCLDDVVFLHYNDFASFHWCPLHNGRSGERIRGKNEIVDPIKPLSAESLRSIFVLLEALVYKSVHLNLENGSASYGPKTENYETRLERLFRHTLITKTEHHLGRELYQTRNQFAHSIKPVEELTYMSQPLKVRWGAGGTSKSSKLKRHLLGDAFKFSEALLRVFKPAQMNQIDGETFKELLLSNSADAIFI